MENENVTVTPKHIKFTTLDHCYEDTESMDKAEQIGSVTKEIEIRAKQISKKFKHRKIFTN